MRVPERFLAAVKRMLLRHGWGKQAALRYLHRITDCYVVSYPKSGRTWLRVMLAKALALHFGYPETVVFDPLKVVRRGRYDAPRVRFVHLGPYWTEFPASGEIPFPRFRKRKVILLARDPRDVVVSHFFHRTRRQGEQHELDDFVWHASWGIKRIVSFMNEWLSHRDVPRDFLLVRYEDMYAQPELELRKILDFLGLSNVSDEHVSKAVYYGRFENMRRMSVSELEDESKLAPTDPADPESFKVRRGEIGGYTNYLSSPSIEEIDHVIRSRLDPRFGYPG